LECDKRPRTVAQSTAGSNVYLNGAVQTTQRLQLSGYMKPAIKSPAPMGA